MKNVQLKHFVEIVDCGSISKAAEQLYISQPSLSRSIQALELEMGKELFVRGNRGVTLTSAGRTLYFYARSILSQFQVLEQLKNTDEEVLYSNLMVSVAMLMLGDNLFFQFYKRMKSSETEINLIETTIEETLKNLTNLVSEIGVVALNSHQLPMFKKIIDAKDIDMEIISKGPAYIHLKGNNLDTQRESINVNELLPYTHLRLPSDFFWNLNLSIDIDNVQIASFEKTIIVNNCRVLKHMLCNVDAFLIGHKWQVAELGKAGIHSFKLENCDIEIYLVLLKRKRETLSVAGSIFYDILIENYKDL